MESIQMYSKQIIVRILIVAGTGMVIGFLLFRAAIFIPTMTTFQFTISSVTVGLFYSILKSSTLRNGLVALLIWYFVNSAFFDPHNRWMLVLNLVYIGGIAGACYLSMFTIKKGYVHSMVMRIATLTVFIAIVNGLIVFFLSLFSWHRAIAHQDKLFQIALSNLELGAMIGLGLGIGIEIAEYVINKYFTDEANSDETVTNAS
jgi:hypothetical protein